MIRYDLVCEHEHGFDGWFRDSSAYEAQLTAGEIACPLCGSTRVKKQLMTPGIPAKGNRRDERAKQSVAMPQDPRAKALAEMVRKLRRHVEENADYVGERFPEEARRIHYEEVEPRGIYGEASPDEVSSLVDEGIEVHPLPRLPEDGN
jgi:hypothetical protein